MYACVYEIGRGFFEGVCRYMDRPPTFPDSPDPGIRELTLEDALWLLNR
jgi:hypothetical protein